MKISDENVKSRQYEPTKAYIIGLIITLKIKNPLKQIMHNHAFSLKFVSNVTSLGHELTYFVKHERKDKRCYTENEVISTFYDPTDLYTHTFSNRIFFS